eukprot:TRINITY_DN23420_c0_g2_i1.p1 TRINITY_DN23420_c0_g2~~TRINITY_DN23420_c0_g2_i1.p1  ORF type:complete len:398 (+),score=56.71 TRINITY_DN23420_c0_g2_i1:195-1388(+)
MEPSIQPVRDWFESSIIADGFGSAPLSEWFILLCFLIITFVIDVKLIASSPHPYVLKIVFWSSAVAVYDWRITYAYGEGAGAEWFFGFLLELFLSFDNLLLFHLLFQTFRPPHEAAQSAMTYGVIMALAFRLVSYLTLGAILDSAHWVRSVFGVLLVYSGFRATMEDFECDPAEVFAVRGLRWVLGSRLLRTYDDRGGLFTVGDDGLLYVTMLMPLVICLEATDVIFGTDNISVKLSQIPNQFISFSSTAFAVLWLWSLFFLVRRIVVYFDHFQYAVCAMLIFLGIELLCENFIRLPARDLCGAIAFIFGFAMLSSMCAKSSQAECANNANNENPNGGESHTRASTDDICQSIDVEHLVIKAGEVNASAEPQDDEPEFEPGLCDDEGCKRAAASSKE